MLVRAMGVVLSHPGVRVAREHLESFLLKGRAVCTTASMGEWCFAVHVYRQADFILAYRQGP